MPRWNKPPSAQARAEALGYYVRRGSYMGTTDDRLDRWYVGNHANEFFRPWGAGYRTLREAWEAALEMAGKSA